MIAKERVVSQSRNSLLATLNGEWHKKALWIYGIIVVIHSLEHVLQAYQVYVLKMVPAEALGLLGFVFPALVKAEVLHFTYAVFQLGGLLLLAPAFVGRGRTWWMIAIVLQTWHFIEHSLLQGQAIFGVYLFGQSVPTSIGQLLIRRVDLHLIYNTVVVIPTIIGLYYHLYPPQSDTQAATCACNRHAEAS